MRTQKPPKIPLPKGWPSHVKSGVLHIISLAHFSITRARGWAVDEGGPKALLQLPEPVNRFPDFVRYAVQRLKTLCPTMGKVKIAQTLARAGLHLCPTTVGRMLKEPSPAVANQEEMVSIGRLVTANGPNHVWHLDLTIVPTVSGFWASWLPFALPQSWPFCWWVSVAIDHYSRRLMSLAVFPNKPDSRTACAFLESVIRCAASGPKYLVCDKDKIFWCKTFKDWCRREGIKPRYGAVGEHGSISVVERAIRTLKNGCTRRILVPQRRREFSDELLSFQDWYNEHRPHMTLEGNTPNEGAAFLPPVRATYRLLFRQ